MIRCRCRSSVERKSRENSASAGPRGHPVNRHGLFGCSSAVEQPYTMVNLFPLPIGKSKQFKREIEVAFYWSIMADWI